MLSIRNMPRGIDVSDNNGDFHWLPWNGHIEFAMAKAGEGPTRQFPTGYRDTQFDRNWQMMKEIDVYRFAYWYGIPDHNPARQARQFVDLVKARGLEPHDNFVLDLEETNGMPPHLVSFWAWVFCRTVNELAPPHRILVYTYPWFAEEGNCGMLGFWHLWIANYEVPEPMVPGPWDTWTFWQNVGSGLDLDLFHGDDAGLQEFCER